MGVGTAMTPHQALRSRSASFRVGILAFTILAVLSVVVLEISHRRAQAQAEHAIATTDNLMRARVSLLEAHLAWERTSLADPTFEPLRALAELENARGHLADLLDGRTPLLGFSQQSLQDHLEVSQAIVELEGRITELRGRLTRGPTLLPVTVRLQFSELERVAAGLERQIRQTVEETLVGEARGHTLFVGGWIVFLLLSGLGGTALHRRGARAATAAAEARSEESSAQAARDRAERRLATLRALTDAGVVLVDPEGRIEDLSAWWAKVLGLRLEEWEGRPWWALLHPDEEERMLDLWREKRLRRLAFSFEARAPADDSGGESWFTALWRPMDGRAGSEEAHEEDKNGATRAAPTPEEQGWVGTFLDITRHRSVEAQFQQSQKLEAVGRMSSSLAHDFNNLLTVTLSSVDLLRDGRGLSEADREQLLSDIHQAARSGCKLVEDLLRFGRSAELEIRPVDLSEAVRGGLGLAQHVLPHSVEVVVEAPAAGPVVHADVRALHQILLNLVTNARDAMPEGGRLVVSVDRVVADEAFVEDRPWIEGGLFGRVTVTDTGVGMDRETADRVFDPFFSTKPEGVGTGLGLASVHGLVRQHGGHIHVYSEPGVGTSFRTYLPLVGSGEETTGAPGNVVIPGGGLHVIPARQSQEGEPARTDPFRILLVDDDEALRRTAQRALAQLGHIVTPVGDAAEALTAIEESAHSFDLILSDLTMPKMDGLELAQEIRARGLGIPVLLTSGRHPSHLDGNDPQMVGVSFLPKPWTVNDLRRKIEEVTAGV